jgi:hypothetical protein
VVKGCPSDQRCPLRRCRVKMRPSSTSTARRMSGLQAGSPRHSRPAGHSHRPPSADVLGPGDRWCAACRPACPARGPWGRSTTSGSSGSRSAMGGRLPGQNGLLRRRGSGASATGCRAGRGLRRAGLSRAATKRRVQGLMQRTSRNVPGSSSVRGGRHRRDSGRARARSSGRPRRGRRRRGPAGVPEVGLGRGGDQRPV